MILVIGATLIPVSSAIIMQIAFDSFYPRRLKWFLLSVVLLLVGIVCVLAEYNNSRICTKKTISYIASSVSVNGSIIKFDPAVKVYASYYDTPWYFACGGRRESTYVITPNKEK